MQRQLALCLAVCSTLAFAGTKPKPKAKPAAPQARGNEDLPLAGSPAELLDPATGKGRAVGAMLESLTDYQATAFPDGRVLITGGSLIGPNTEWFDPATRRFSPGPAMTQARQGHRALLLADGRLLLVGGTEGRAPAEQLLPGATRFQALPGDLKFGLSAEAVPLDEGKVFLVDGASGQCSIWDGKQSLRPQATLNRPRNFFRALRLKDGKVLITGGLPSEQKVKGRVVRASAGAGLPVECFNPRWSTLSVWKALPQPRARHQVALLADGRVCLWAGYGLDAASACDALELLDPAKETVTAAGSLNLAGLAQPGWTEGLYLAEKCLTLRKVPGPAALAEPETPGGLRLANGFLAPTLVPLKDGRVLVLGTPAWGEPVDRWDPRTKQCSVVGSMRAGVTGLGLTSDGKVLALGPVVDLLDPRSGALKPLGWKTDLDALLRTVKPAPAAAAGTPPFAPGQARKDYLVVDLDKGKALVLGGSPEGSEEPTDKVELWDLKKRTLTPMGSMKVRRAFRAKPEGLVQGALRLPDGSVLFWGPGKTS